MDNPEGDYEIFTVDTDGTDLNQITRNATDDWQPEWSADGQRIAYSGYDGNDREIYTVPAGGGQPAQVTDNAKDDRWPSFSADGTKITYSGVATYTVPDEDYSYDVRNYYSVPASGGTPTLLYESRTHEREGPFRPDVSPDGTKIAHFHYASQGFNSLGVLDLATGGGYGLTQDSPVETECCADWSPDGERIAFMGMNREPISQFDIYTVPASGGKPAVAIDTPDESEYDPAWSPDGSRIAFHTSKPSGRCHPEAAIHTATVDGRVSAEATKFYGTVDSLDWGSAPQDDADPPDVPAPDTEPPAVYCTYPEEGSSYSDRIDLHTTVSAGFSEEMDASTLNRSAFYLTKEGSEKRFEATVRCDKDPCYTVRLDPTSNLAPDTTYGATVKGGGVKDLAGNALAADKTWSFATEDTTPPTVSIMAPAKEAVVSGSNVTMSAEVSDNRGVRGWVKFYVDGRYAGSDYEPNGQEYSISWDSTRVPDGPKTVQVSADDSAFNTGSATRNITVDNVQDPPEVDTTPPMVTAVVPQHRREDVRRDSFVKVAFSESMQPSSLYDRNVTLVEARTGRRVEARMNCDHPCTRISINPRQQLVAETTYRVTAKTGAEDLAGNALDQKPNVASSQPKVWSFRTKD